MPQDPFHALGTLSTRSGSVQVARLSALSAQKVGRVDRLPFSIKILLESTLRNLDGKQVREQDVRRLAQWDPKVSNSGELPFKPGRVVLQDFTGVPALVDLAALRSALARKGGDPKRINPIVPCDLVIDHSVQVDAFGSEQALAINAAKEFERNRERYAFLRWGSKAFSNFRLVPPATGIVHQVNLEYLARVVMTCEEKGRPFAFPDSLVGTDSHTTMINGIGVLGWGVGGIEAEAAMLGGPLFMRPPQVIGFKLMGHLPEGSTATDLVLTVTELLRSKGVVGKFIEFFGNALSKLSVPDRATIANMCPEYGATAAYFPVDQETLTYLKLTGRPEELVDLVERYTKEQGLFRTDETPAPEFTEVVQLDLGTVEPSLAGPKRPQDRLALSKAKEAFRNALASLLANNKPARLTPDRIETWLEEGGKNNVPATGAVSAPSALFATDRGGSAPKGPIPPPTGGGMKSGGGVATQEDPFKQFPVKLASGSGAVGHGSVVIAAITSCTNTSNPSVMVGAGLLAKKAVERGLKVPPTVKTSLAPGSRVVTEYLDRSGLTPYLEKLGFYTVGYGCTTCIGNSGPLPEPVARAIDEHDLFVAAVLSGNRNFEGRIHPQVRANYLASPMLVVAYALAGTMNVDLTRSPLGTDAQGKPVFLKEIWPSRAEITEVIFKAVTKEAFQKRYSELFDGTEEWKNLPTPEGDLYEWDPQSSYIQEPPFFVDFTDEPGPLRPIRNARVLVKAGDSVTTDHISPAGSIAKDSPAGRYLIEQGMAPQGFNSYGSRRGNDRVMARGTFANVRMKNELAPGTEGWWTTHWPSRERLSIFEAAQRYRQEGVPLLVLAGKEYGSGSSRDWAAKGPALLGVRAVIAEGYERIHRSNLVGMGILPLEFVPGESLSSLALTGREIYTIEELKLVFSPAQKVKVTAKGDEGSPKVFEVLVRIDAPIEMEYYRHGGILAYVLRRFLQR